MSKMALYWIDPASAPDNFPPADMALQQPDGLLCFGGDLSPERLMFAYRQGIFPWYSGNQPILWWSPDPRCVLFPDELKINRSLKKTIRNAGFSFSMDMAFESVISACSQPRSEDEGTWITDKMQEAYINLHKFGHAHSVEIWQQDKLVGGLYGIAIGRVFFGESMFSKQRDSSKVALYCLTKLLKSHNFQLIDCQVSSSHLYSLGAGDIRRTEFIQLLNGYCTMTNTIKLWQYEPVDTRTFCQQL